MIKNILNKQIEITLQPNRVVADPFLRFIEKWIKAWYTHWEYYPHTDFIWTWKVYDYINSYQKLIIKANNMNY